MIKKKDRVRVYATLNGTPAETKGTITAIRKDGMFEVVLEDKRYWAIVAHPKQCRRLVKKKRCGVHMKGPKL